MQRGRGAASMTCMSETIETTTSVTVIHGAMLSFESIGATTADDAPVRLREHHETLLRVIDGIVILAIEGAEQTLTIEEEARIPSSAEHRIWNAGSGDARIVQELRRTR
jgi:glyoxylate utilization-related uncharacterized protein